MKMKKMFMLVLIVAGSLTAFAQNRGGDQSKELTPDERIDKIMTRMTSELNLNADQQSQIREMITKREVKRSEEGLTPDDKKAMKEDIDAILTDEQRAKRDEMMRDRKRQHHKPMPDKGNSHDSKE